MSNIHEINQPGRVAVPAPGLSAPAPLAPNEDPAEFVAALKCFRTELRPRSMVQHVLVFQIATVAWRLRNIGFHQTQALSGLTKRRSAALELTVLTHTETSLQASLCRLLAEFEASGWTVPKDRPRAAATS